MTVYKYYEEHEDLRITKLKIPKTGFGVNAQNKCHVKQSHKDAALRKMRFLKITPVPKSIESGESGAAPLKNHIHS